MREIQNLGYRTDCVILHYNGQIEEKEEYYVIRTPSNPTYYWGNFLLYKFAPKKGLYDSWIEAFHREFGPDFNHMTFGWDSNQLGEIETFLENRFGTERNKALKLAHLKTPRPTTEGLEIRKIENGAEWEAVLQLQLLISRESHNPAYIEFKQRKFHSYREASEKGFGDW